MIPDASEILSAQATVIVADIGGTNVRFGVLEAANDTIIRLARVEVFRCADFPSPVEAIQHYLSKVAIQAEALQALCLAVPGPVHLDPVFLVNNPWSLSRSTLAATFSCAVFLLNDFSAQALSLPLLRDIDLDWLRPPEQSDTGLTRAVLGPGTGLGVAALLPDARVVESEAGHMSFAPVSELQQSLLPHLRKFHGRVSNERLLSGPGLENLYYAMSLIHGAERKLPAELVTSRAAEGDALAVQTVREFCRILGAVSGDLALAFDAVGGVYLSGGLMPVMAAFLDKQELLAEFDRKGRYSDYCSAIPVARVTHPYPGLLGAGHHALRCLDGGID